MLKSFKNDHGSGILSDDANEDNIQYGRTSVEELEIELRQKYLTILKSIYWEFYEEGQCMPDTVIALIESADRCLDVADEQKMNDWEFI